MNPEIILKDLKRQLQDFLTIHPEEQEKSTGFVHDNIELDHVKAAIFMHVNQGMQLNAYNLHDLILNYDQYKTLVECSPDDMVIADINDLQPGVFNPKNLIIYFRQLILTH